MPTSAGGKDSTLFVPGEIEQFQKIFNGLDADKDGHISQGDLAKALSNLGIKLKENEMRKVIEEVDLNNNGTVEFNEFLEVLAAVKDIRSRKRFARIVAEYEEREQVPTDRSGGGV